MIYSYTLSSAEGVYLFVTNEAAPANNKFQTVRFSQCQSGTAAGAPIAGITPTFDINYSGYDAEHFYLQPTSGVVRLIANSGINVVGPPATTDLGRVLHLLELNLGTLAFTQISTITLSFAPTTSGFRQMPGTSFILYAGVKQGDLGIIEHVPATAPNVFQRIVPVFKHPQTNVFISDVKPVVENGAIKYLVIVYIGFTETVAPFNTVVNAQFRVYSPPANFPAPTALSCGGSTIAGCKTCGTGTTVNPGKCEVCADGQGRVTRHS